MLIEMFNFFFQGFFFARAAFGPLLLLSTIALDESLDTEESEIKYLNICVWSIKKKHRRQAASGVSERARRRKLFNVQP
jgi:hypothetical protein